MYKFILFDFDGTIANTVDAGIPLYNELARKYGFIEIKRKEEIRSHSLKEFVKIHKISRTRFIFYFRELLKNLNDEMDKVKPYEGMLEVVRELKKHYKLAILSTNSKENINKFLKAHKMDIYFEFIENYSLLLGKSKKINKIMRKRNLEKDELLYIGDEIRDINATKKAGVDIIAVTWGFHKKEILQEKNPKFIAENPNDKRC
ncbi:HAD-IA family hydrolase [Candidatus Woesearchaeota archaeon]|nr:HAD-IA family hydrolase [Candidatus Woesearchaeota archaeon]